jgi:hypothetical protein
MGKAIFLGMTHSQRCFDFFVNFETKGTIPWASVYISRDLRRFAAGTCTPRTINELLSSARERF